MKKRLIITLLIYSIVMILFLIGSYVFNLPVLLLISVYALTITTLALQFNHWILNSLSIPFTFTYSIALLHDLIEMNPLFAIFHIPIVFSCYIIIWRKNTSLLIMIIMSSIYAFWIFAIKTWIYFPYYDCIFNICHPFHQFIYIMLVGITTSYIGSLDFKTRMGHLINNIILKIENILKRFRSNLKVNYFIYFLLNQFKMKILKTTYNLIETLKNKFIPKKK